MGVEAAPFVAVRTADSQAHVRSWATRLLGELPTKESGAAVAKRLVDSDEGVRRSALAAARMLQSCGVASTAVREQVLGLARDPQRSSDQRHAAIEALTDIRDPGAVPAFIDLLADSDPDLAKSAHWGLAVLTRADLGASVDAWQTWWKANGDRHRVEWLIDALMHENPDIRRAAGDELKNVSKEYFGYYDDLPKKERAAAQQRYQDWWNSNGSRLFS
jgi:HEAT repeat protein